MKLTFATKNLMEALSPMLACVSTKRTSPSAECVLLDIHSEYAVLVTYDLDKGMEKTVDCRSDGEGKVLIPAQRLMQILGVLRSPEFEMEITDRLAVIITAGKSVFRLMAQSADTFPRLPELHEEGGMVFSQHVLKEIFQKGRSFMGVNDNRPVLNGCFIKLLGDTLLAIACDSFRLAKFQAPCQGQNLLMNEFILPTSAVEQLEKLLCDDVNKTLRVTSTRKTMVFHFDNATFFTKLVEGAYIDYNRILEKPISLSVTMPEEELLYCLDRASLVTEEKVAGATKACVKLTLKGSVMNISAESMNGAMSDELPLTTTEADAELVMGFNNKYLRDAVKAVEPGELRMSFTGGMGGVFLEAVNPGEIEEKYLVLPVRLKE